MSEITPDVVRSYKTFTDKFLCEKDANTYNIRFRRFKVRDIDSDFVLFEVADDSPDEPPESEKDDKKKKRTDQRRKRKRR